MVEPENGYPEAPIFVDRFEGKTVKQKSTITLKARVIGNPVPEITWLRNNQLLHQTDKIIQSYDGENIELVILEADSETDTGDYKCIASNTYGKASHGARITVDVDDVRFTKILKKSITIEESQNLTLECRTSHTISTKWYHNEKELTGMDHRIIIQEGKIHKLLVKNTNIKDSGNYKCVVKNQETSSVVEVLERSPEFVARLQDTEVNENESIILEVEITSNSADVVWLKDGSVIDIENNKNVDYIKDGHCRKLILRSASIHDEGEYTCRLMDEECSADLNVIESPPSIVTPLKDVTCTEGEKTVFEVELTKGDALVRWFRNGKDLEFSDRLHLSIDGKRQRLIITPTNLSDTGMYSCTVGDHSCEATLTVEKPIVDFIVKLPDVTITNESADVQLTVQLSQPDVEVTWYKKNKKIEPSSKYSIDVEGTYRKLIIVNATEEDIGDYSCVAENVKTTTNLRVEGNVISFC